MLRKLLLCVALAGCSPTTIPVLQANAPVAVQNAQPMTLNAVNWQVMSLPQLQALVKKLQSDQKRVVFTLDAQGYTNLTLNLVEIERYLNEQKTIINMLQKIIADRSDQGLVEQK